MRNKAYLLDFLTIAATVIYGKTQPPGRSDFWHLLKNRDDLGRRAFLNTRRFRMSEVMDIMLKIGITENGFNFALSSNSQCSRLDHAKCRQGRQTPGGGLF